MRGLDYTPLANKIKNIINRHWHIIENISGCHQRPFIGMRKTRRIRDILILADLKGQRTKRDSPPIGQYRCGKCCVCSQVWVTDSFSHNNYHVKLRHFSTCTTKGIVYFLKCVCGRDYIGASRWMICTAHIPFPTTGT